MAERKPTVEVRLGYTSFREYEDKLAEKDKQLKYANESRETIRLKMILALAEKDKRIKELEADINAFRSGVDFYAREQAALSERDVAWKRIKELETVAMTEIASLKADLKDERANADFALASRRKECEALMKKIAELQPHPPFKSWKDYAEALEARIAKAKNPLGVAFAELAQPYPDKHKAKAALREVVKALSESEKG